MIDGPEPKVRASGNVVVRLLRDIRDTQITEGTRGGPMGLNTGLGRIEAHPGPAPA